MSQKLLFTEEVVDALPLAKDVSRIEFQDTKDKYLHLRVSANKKTFLAVKKAMGRTFRITLGDYPNMKVKAARTECGKKIAELRDGVDPVKEKKQKVAEAIESRKVDEANKYTLQDALDDYLKDRKLKPKTVSSYNSMFRLYLKDWINTPIMKISSDDVKKRHNEIAQGKRQRQMFSKEVVTEDCDGEQVNKLVKKAVESQMDRKASADGCMRVLRAVLNHALADYEEDGKARVNPVVILSKKKKWYQVGRRRTLIKSSELPRWYKAVMDLENPDMRDYLRFLLFTGLRRTSEAAKLKWAHVDFEEKTLTFPDTKNKEPHILPMSDYLYDLFEKRYAEAPKGKNDKPLSPYVFPSGGKHGYLQEPKRAIDAVSEATGIIFTSHDLRRTFETIAESLDLSKYTLKALVNHKQDKGDVTAGYIILNVERLRDPMQRVTDAILEKINKKESQVIPMPSVNRKIAS